MQPQVSIGANLLKNHNPNAGLAMLDTMGVDNLETRAWRVLLLSARDHSSQAVRDALDKFLELVEPQAVSNWKFVQTQLESLIRPILDNNYGYNVMRALRAHYIQSDKITYSDNFSWAPRGLMVYGLNKGLSSEDTELPPKTMLQWLSRLVKDEDEKMTGIVGETLQTTGHVLFSLWSCLYDNEPKGKKVKYMIASKKIESIDHHTLVRTVLSAPVSPERYHCSLILLDFFWLRNLCRCITKGHGRTFLKLSEPILGNRLEQDSFMDLVDALISDRELVEDEMSTFWMNQKFQGFAIELLENLSESVRDDDAFMKLMSHFLLDSEFACLEAVRIYQPFSPDTQKTVLAAVKSSHESPIFLANFLMELPRTQFSESELEGLLPHVVTERVIESEAFSIFRRLQNTPFMNLLIVALNKVEAPIVWYTTAIRFGVAIKQQLILNRWKEVEDLILADKLNISSLSLSEVQELELISLSAWDLLIATNFDEQIMSLLPVIKKIAALPGRGIERLKFLCLCCCIYLGDPTVKILIKDLNLKAIQLISLAWALNGFERLWKSNIWTQPRVGNENTERLYAQGGSVALLTLDNGSLQGLWYQVEIERVRWRALASLARRYSELIDAVCSKKNGWESAAVDLTKFNFWDQTTAGDCVPLLGTAQSMEDVRNNAHSGLAQLAYRLMGYHLCHENIPAAYPACAHYCLERALKGERINNYDSCVSEVHPSLLTSAETTIRTVRAAVDI